MVRVEKSEDAEAPARCSGVGFTPAAAVGLVAPAETGAEATGLFIASKSSIWPTRKHDRREGGKTWGTKLIQGHLPRSSFAEE